MGELPSILAMLLSWPTDVLGLCCTWLHLLTSCLPQFWFLLTTPGLWLSDSNTTSCSSSIALLLPHGMQGGEEW